MIELSTGVFIQWTSCVFDFYQIIDVTQLQRDNTVHPGSYTLHLNSVDDVDNISRSISAKVLERRENTLVLLMKRLPWKRLWKCTITAHACRVQASLSTEELSEYIIM